MGECELRLMTALIQVQLKHKLERFEHKVSGIVAHDSSSWKVDAAQKSSERDRVSRQLGTESQSVAQQLEVEAVEQRVCEATCKGNKHWFRQAKGKCCAVVVPEETPASTPRVAGVKPSDRNNTAGPSVWQYAKNIKFPWPATAEEAAVAVGEHVEGAEVVHICVNKLKLKSEDDDAVRDPHEAGGVEKHAAMPGNVEDVDLALHSVARQVTAPGPLAESGHMPIVSGWFRGVPQPMNKTPQAEGWFRGVPKPIPKPKLKEPEFGHSKLGFIY